MTLVESFEWTGKIDDLPKSRLLKAVVKSPSPEGTTFHPEDPEYKVRIFAEQEVMKGIRSLVGKPVGLNHQKFPIFGAYCVDAEWSEESKRGEAILFVPQAFADKVEKGEISKVSIEYKWRNEKRDGDAVEFEGLWLTRIDLLEGLGAGDKTTSVTLFESSKRIGRFLMEAKTLGEPFADYADMDACIAANQDKEDPAAYCASIKAKTEQDGETPEEACKAKGGHWYDDACHEEPKATEQAEPETTSTGEVPTTDPIDIPETKESCEAKGGVWDEEAKTCALPQGVESTDPKDKRIKELEEAVKIATKATADLKENQNKAVESAVNKAKLELIQKVESVVPFQFTRQGMAYQKFIQDIKKVLREARGE